MDKFLLYEKLVLWHLWRIGGRPAQKGDMPPYYECNAA